MSSFPEREKDLPAVPVDTDVSRTVAVGYPIPSSNIAISSNTNKSLPSIKVENTLSEEEIRRLHELWNGTGLSAVSVASMHFLSQLTDRHESVHIAEDFVIKIQSRVRSHRQSQYSSPTMSHLPYWYPLRGP